ncbi:MAG: hypothetical protein RLZZ312_1610 [Bacteroidota bacterium]|jgi:glyoxylase-like metal-dependent hydrolase (beta-lactamase superfamily II)/rhodanese-related sulfurtransferase
MKIEQIYTGCLAQGAYYVTADNEAFIIDPLREIQPYLDRLHNDNVKLKYIFETHFHADFVSGHLDLAQKTGAQIVYGPNANPDFKHISAIDSQVFEIGNIKIKVLHTPGHTLESTTFLLIDENQKNHAIFTGDTLFIGDVGRPDLAQKATTLTQEQLAGMLFHSLRNKIMILEDDVLVYPAHGAGSACGKNMSKETFSTLGEQKLNNYALRANMTEAEFIAEVTDGLLPPPAYFGSNVTMNKSGIESFETVFNRGNLAINAFEFQQKIQTKNIVVLDTRNSTDFALGHIPNAINIGIKGDFAPWVGAIISNVKTPLLLVCDLETEQETVTRLSRVGFDNVIGFLENGFETWQKSGFKIENINRISAQQFENEFDVEKSIVIDVRKISEYEAEHVTDAFSKPLAAIADWKVTLPTNHFFVHCAGGYRSMIAASVIKRNGTNDFSEIDGGFNAIAKTTIETSDFVCGSKVI